MNILVKYLIESSIIISVFYLIYMLVFNGDKGSRFNRLYLLFSSLFAIILPLLEIPIIPVQKVEYYTSFHQAIQLPEIIIKDNSAVISSQSGFTISQIISFTYLAGFIFFLSRFLYELFITFRHIRIYSNNSRKSDIYTIIDTQGKLPTCSFYKYLFWDNTQNINEKESNFIIKHEEGHIRQNHTFDLIYLEILRIIFWFNPIVHGYKKAMLTVHEYLADEFALANTNEQGFVALLGKQVLQRYNLTLSNHFSKSQTVKRIKMIKSGKKKPAVLRWIVMVTAVLTMFYFFSCEQGYSLNELIPQDKDLPVLGSGWTYVSSESLSPWLSEKIKSLKDEHPSTEFYIAKGLSGKFEDFSPNEILDKHGFKSFLFAQHEESFYVFLGKVDKEIIEIPPSIKSEPILEGEEIFTVVEDIPEPVGGMPALYEYISKNLKYPEEARKKSIEGKVFVEFIVKKDGSIANVKCVKGIGELCDSEAVQVVSNGPPWIPGQHKGKNVNVRLILPITFKLGQSEEKK